MGQDCKRNSWIAAAALGALVFLVILIFGTVEFFGSIVIGVAVAIVLGFFFTMFLCPGEDAEETEVTTADPAPAAMPVASPAASATAAVTPKEPAPAPAEAPVKQVAEPVAAKEPAKPEPVKPEPAAALAPAAAPEPAPEPVPAPASEPTPETAPTPPASTPAAPTTEGTRPVALDSARGGKADDLKRIRGVGPKLELQLNEMGFYHFDQIAAWSGDEVAWVDQNLKGFKGRVSRDNWVDQATQLAMGGETEFSKRVDKGGVY